MKKLYFIPAGDPCGQFFVDKDANLIGWFDNNDAEWRDEYMRFIPKFFDGEVVQLEIEEIHTSEELEKLGWEGAGSLAMYKVIKPFVVKALAELNS